MQSRTDLAGLSLLLDELMDLLTLLGPRLGGKDASHDSVDRVDKVLVEVRPICGQFLTERVHSARLPGHAQHEL